MNQEIMEQAARAVQERFSGCMPKAGLVLGSGWSDVVGGFEVHAELDYDAIPGLGRTSVAGHAGRLVWARTGGFDTLIFQGRRHFYEGDGWTPVVLPIYVLRKLGAETLLLTNAAGGVRSDLAPGTLMAIADHINRFPTNPLIGPHKTFWGPRFPDLSCVYDAALRAKLKEAAAAIGETLAEGVYLASTGPAYETPAEVRSYQVQGADAVGMSTVNEAIMAHAAGLRVAGLSCITNWAAGISPTPLTHEEVTETTRHAMPRMRAFLQAYWKLLD